MRRLATFLRRRRVAATLQVVAAVVLVGALALAVRGSWAGAADRIAGTDPLQLALALVSLAAYYLLFVLGWMWILRVWGIRLSYATALQAEMVSMLAKYVPGGVWTPAARVLAVRRAGVTDNALVLGSVLVEAGLSAIAGILVFVAALAAGAEADAQLLPVLGFGVLVVVLLHPRVFPRLARIVLRPFGGTAPPALPFRTMLGLLGYYAFTWLVGGLALYFLLRAVGGEPAVDEIAFLGGTAAVGAIVAVLSIIAPSGLGVREASMYSLLLGVVPAGAALGATVLNRLAITVVEAALLLAGALLWRLRRPALVREPAP
jgi:uncharacterized membrane protein YbhN (UPF0104 family)